MSIDGETPRGRVVMLVDNAVEGDSRVQKSARSMSEAGWDVTLLGCGPVEQTWMLGPAKVRVLKMGGGAPARGIKQQLLARGGVALKTARLARRPLEKAQVGYWSRRLGNGSWRQLEPGL